MFGLFKKENSKEKLEKQYKKLIDESYKLSHTNRAASDLKQAEAEEILNQIKSLEK
jgi:hypothetical protein